MKTVRLSRQDKKRLTKRVVLDQITLEDLCGSPSDVSRFILENTDNCEEYDSLLYESYTEYYERNEHNDYLQLVGYRQETDEEYNKRIENLKEAKCKEIEKLEKAEKKVLKELLKKYGKN